MNEMKQLSLIPDGTPEQAQAMGLHYEIMAAAQAAANSLLALGRKLKQMRDTGGYKRLGFETFADYTEQAVGIRQRQAYNYISVVENVPARLVEENAAAGVTKLALLAKLSPADQQEVAGQDLANITVTELKQIIEEKNGLAEQLSMLQETAPPAAEAESHEVDMDALRAEMLEQARAEVADAHRKELDSALKAQADHLAADHAEALRRSTESTRREVQEAADRKTAELVEQAAENARREQEEKDSAALEQARQTAQEMQLSASEESIRFAVLFEQLQNAAQEMMDLVDTLTAEGRTEEAVSLRTALIGALQALAEQVPGGADV
ncbi:MAG: hypothetical protein ACI4KC_08885 [Gemmiger sp.]